MSGNFGGGREGAMLGQYQSELGDEQHFKHKCYNKVFKHNSSTNKILQGAVISNYNQV